MGHAAPGLSLEPRLCRARSPDRGGRGTGAPGSDRVALQLRGAGRTMIFAPPFHRVVEHVDRRVLGAFQFVDAVTQLPVVMPANIEVRGATLLGNGGPVDVP